MVPWHRVTYAFLVTQSIVVGIDMSDMELEEFQLSIPTFLCQFFTWAEPVADPVETLNLNIDEFTTAGRRNHSFHSGAAKSLMSSSYFDPKRKTVIFIHGFINSPDDDSVQAILSAYETHGGYNILALDSSKLIGELYFRSSVMVKYIGGALALLLQNLNENGVDIRNIHLVGHSLGAHIAGFAGKSLKLINPHIKLPRITGLDPAGPCFSNGEINDRLDKDDAEFVDVIHTNAGFLGIEEPIGHADFFVNSGISQPGCWVSVCSHDRARIFYKESININNSFIGVSCTSEEDFYTGKCDNNEKAVMGFATPNNVRGIFYLWTADNSVYGKGIAGAYSPH